MNIQLQIDFLKLDKDQAEALMTFIMLYRRDLMQEDTKKLPVNEFVCKEAQVPDPKEVFGSAPYIAGVVPLPITPPVTPGSTLAPPPPVNIPPVPQAAPLVVAHSVPVPPTNPVNGVELDSTGLPWDGRIHAGTREKKQDGTWRQKRGVDKDLVTQVETQLRQTMSAPQVTPSNVFHLHTEPVPTSMSISIGNTDVHAASAIPSQTTTYIGPSSLSGDVTGIAPPPPPQASMSFPQFVSKVSKAITFDKSLTKEQVDAICKQHGIDGLPLLANRPDLIPQISAQIDSLILSK